MKSKKNDFGLYIHIPFCSKICHYCDFSKTSKWDSSLVKSYFHVIEKELFLWREKYLKPNQISLSSVYLGGGTPGLFAQEYKKIAAYLENILQSDYEFTIEANPEDFDEKKLLIWKGLGINRVSLGIQTFNTNGLKFLTRAHTAKKSLESIEILQKHSFNYSTDFIYGWKGQSLEDWQRDLDTIASIRPPHLSLYSLTYEPGTPIGRAQLRGKLESKDDNFYTDCYELSCGFLRQLNYVHEEVSNWSQKGKFAR
ncbi:MAG: coproporphyrinogen III oxidase, partial [Zetaproteobacteria bacterium]|nr:coproporphyrinogen III oxidase [Pseudobdellovibrionaceae bacterium]